MNIHLPCVGFALTCLASASCFQATSVGITDGGGDDVAGDHVVTDDGVVPDGCYAVQGLGGGIVCAARAAAVCNGVACPSGEICCYATFQCFDPVAAPDACAVAGADAGPVPGNEGDGAPVECASDNDCTPDEFCGNATWCQGVGYCEPRSNCGLCSTGDCPTCGCDGVTYPSIQVACAAGARVAGGGMCGAVSALQAEAGVSGVRIPCGTDSECPSDQTCCGLLGACMPSSCTNCCRFPPTGTSWPCNTDSDCASFRENYCAGDGCGTPGGCTGYGSGADCSGEVAVVCGCDGHEYVNACFANAAGVRVANTGPCGDAG